VRRNEEPEKGGDMTIRGYTVLGWLVWQITTRVAKRKIAQNRVKLGAAGVVALVVVGGLLAARSSEE
jgi:hypothetical protein